MPRLPAAAAVLSVAALITTVATAQTAPSAPPMTTSGPITGGQAPCPAAPTPPAELSGWNAAVPVTAASIPGELALATLQPGRGVRATLQPTAKISYQVAPGHPGEPGTSGGLFAFPIVQAGTYRVALGAGAWIDVVRDGRSIASVAHGHGPACSPVRKTVDFTLSPGRYVLQVSGNRTPTLALLVASVTP